MNKEINYKGMDITEIYKLALIGADFATDKNDKGITTVNSLNKHLYIKTVLVSRFLNILELPNDRVMSLEQYEKCDDSIDNLKGIDVNRLKTDFEIFKDMLNDEINNILACENDAITRFDEEIAISITPEKIKELEKQKDELIAELNKTSK